MLLMNKNILACTIIISANLIGIIREIETDNTMYGWDIINLIRCCDCKFCRTRIDECGNHIPHCSKSFGNMEVDPMDYCSYGKRKEEEE